MIRGKTKPHDETYNKDNKYIFDHIYTTKMPKIKRIIKSAVYYIDCKIKTLKFDNRRKIFIATLIPEERPNIKQTLKREITEIFGDSANLVGEYGPDAWMGGDIVIDDFILFGVNAQKVEFKIKNKK